jgi:hypothetical protein
MRSWLLAPLLVLLVVTPATAARKALFDNTKAETAGNADWVIDNDQPVPSPAQSGIGPATARTYWTGAISSWGVDLVKRGYTVATLTSAYGITYGNSGNPYDLSNYDVFIVDEPNILFTSAEAAAILNYVHDGGGLIAISDHGQSDRNNDGYDSPMIWNAMDPDHLLGVRCAVYNETNNNITQTSTNVNAAAADSITRGPEGNVTGLAFHNGTTFAIYPSANPSVRGEVWMNGTSQTSTTGLMAVSSVYGNGRFFIAGDSSPADDGSANSGNSSIYDGWGEAGATDSTLFMNATIWATRRTATGDATAPAVAVNSPDGGETWKAGATHEIRWTATDAVGVTGVNLAYSTDDGVSFPNAIASGLANDGSYSWTVPNAPGTAVRVRVLAHDAAGNVGRDSSAASFTIDRWTITATAGAGGSVVPGGAVPVVQGAGQSFSIAPAANYHVASLAVDGAAVTPDTSYTFQNVTANHTIAASFSSDSFALVVSQVGGGTVTLSPDLASYAYGTSVELDPVPAAGWAFTSWSGDTTGTADPLTLTVLGNRSLTATFVDVAAPVVTLTAPLGGEAWDLGTVHDVTWTASDNAGVDSVNVDYSRSGLAGPWLPVAHGLANSGTCPWTVPGQASDSALVRVTAYDQARNTGSARSDSVFHLVDPTAGVWGEGPPTLALARPQPNPSRGATLLRFSLPAAGHARLDVVDVSGRRLGSHEGEFEAGVHPWRWDGRGADGGPAGAGLYFVRLVTPWGNRTERLVRLR